MRSAVLPDTRRTLSFAAIVLCALLLIAGALAYKSYNTSIKEKKAAIGRELTAIARTGAAGIDGDRFARLFDARPETDWEGLSETRDFAAIKDELQRIIRSQSALEFTEQNVYTFAPATGAIRPGKARTQEAESQNDPADYSLRWAVMTHDQPFTGEAYQPRPEMLPVLRGESSAASTGVYFSLVSNHEWVSAFAPIKASDGSIAGLLEIAWDAEHVLEQTRAAANRGILIIAGIMMLGFVAAAAFTRVVWVLRNTNRRLGREITERARAEEQILYNAFYDRLTALPNRALFVDRLNSLIRLSKHSAASKYAVLHIDLDRFQRINASMGHERGDTLLKAVAERLQSALRAGDTLARPEADEFWLLLVDLENVSETQLFVDQLLACFDAPFLIEDSEVFVTAAAGIAFTAPHYTSAHEVIQDAQAALREIPPGAHSRSNFSDSEMRNRARSMVALETDMRRGLERGEFEVYYQPIIQPAQRPVPGTDAADAFAPAAPDAQNPASDRDYRLEGFEALIRWSHPERGLVSPGEFIPLAEDTGLIEDIGEFVLQSVCQQIQSWQNQGRPYFFVSVNLAPRQLRAPGFAADLDRLLSNYSIDPRRLELEITESSAMTMSEDPEFLIRLFQQLREPGVRLAIDDFGTGYSSLSYLKRLPVDTVKIDRSFIQDLPDDTESGAITRTIIALAHNLRLDVTAEGVETIEQLNFLRRYDCDRFQGFYFSKPMPVSLASQFLNKPIDSQIPGP
ncbi:MAG: bifunctional diguanylate cyclase/phosphodiesterase [bacterium]|nr:bifunctional diguanylate cyclase/phosphodiesterase [bacterium]